MKKADGGNPVPKFVQDSGNEQLIDAFKLLGSTDTSLGELLFVEKFGETLFREQGWTATAELINGKRGGARSTPA